MLILTFFKIIDLSRRSLLIKELLTKQFLYGLGSKTKSVIVLFHMLSTQSKVHSTPTPAYGVNEICNDIDSHGFLTFHAKQGPPHLPSSA